MSAGAIVPGNLLWRGKLAQGLFDGARECDHGLRWARVGAWSMSVRTG